MNDLWWFLFLCIGLPAIGASVITGVSIFLEKNTEIAMNICGKVVRRLLAFLVVSPFKILAEKIKGQQTEEVQAEQQSAEPESSTTSWAQNNGTFYSSVIEQMEDIKEIIDDARANDDRIAGKKRQEARLKPPAYLRQALFMTNEDQSLLLDEQGFTQPFSVSQLFDMNSICAEEEEETSQASEIEELSEIAEVSEIAEALEMELEDNKPVMLIEMDEEEGFEDYEPLTTSDLQNIVNFPTQGSVDHYAYLDEIDDDSFEEEDEAILWAAQGH